jgi:hypothetical protein
MTKNEIHEQDEGLELAKRMAEEEEGIGRRPEGPSKYVIPFVCVVWSSFQLSIASWLILDSTFIRAAYSGFNIYPGHPSGICTISCFPELSVIQKDPFRPEVLFRHR